MAAAPAETLAAVRPVLDALGDRIFHVGERPGPGRHRQGGQPAPVRRPHRGRRRGAGAGRPGRRRSRRGAGDPVGLLGVELDAARPRPAHAGGRRRRSPARSTSSSRTSASCWRPAASAGAALPLAALAHQLFVSTSGRGDGAADDSQVIRAYRLLNGARRVAVRTASAQSSARDARYQGSPTTGLNEGRTIHRRATAGIARPDHPGSETMRDTRLSRRSLLAGAAALPVFGILTRRGQAAEFDLQARHRPGPDPPGQPPRAGGPRPHPRGDGRPARDQAVPGQPARLGHRPAGAGAQRQRRVLQPRRPRSSPPSCRPRACPTPASPSRITTRSGRRWTATSAPMSGPRSPRRRSSTVSKVWDNGFRQITSSTREIRTPEDLKGFKIRVPPAPMLTSLFKALDAGAAADQLQRALLRAPDQGGRGPGEPARHHRDGPALRGAEDRAA